MRILSIPLAGLLAVASAVSASAGVSGYIKLGDIKGESKDRQHDGWSDVLFWETGIESASLGLAHQGFAIGKPIDAATPLILDSFVTGRIIPQARLRFVDAGDPRKPLFSVRLFDVSLTSHLTELSSGGSAPFEKVGLNFRAAVFVDVQSDETGAPVQLGGTAVDLLDQACRRVGTGTADNDADAVDDALDDDDDDDGISDVLEAEAKLNPLVFDSHLDNDADGTTNGAEAKAGTNAFDPQSRWQVTGVEPAPEKGTRIRWVARKDRSYRIFAASSLQSKWIEIATVTPQTSGPTHADVVPLNEGGIEFYKIEAFPTAP